jgi:hypothetical protein
MTLLGLTSTRVTLFVFEYCFPSSKVSWDILKFEDGQKFLLLQLITAQTTKKYWLPSRAVPTGHKQHKHGTEQFELVTYSATSNLSNTSSSSNGKSILLDMCSGVHVSTAFLLDKDRTGLGIPLISDFVDNVGCPVACGLVD